MKKAWISLVLIVMLLTGMCCAEGGYIRIGDEPVYIENDIAEIDIEIVGNPGIVGIGFFIDIDPEKAILMDYETKDVGKAFLAAINPNFDSGILLYMMAAEDVTEDGKLVTLRLRLLGGAKAEEAIREIKVDAANTFNERYEDVSIEFKK